MVRYRLSPAVQMTEFDGEILLVGETEVFRVPKAISIAKCLDASAYGEGSRSTIEDHLLAELLSAGFLIEAGERPNSESVAFTEFGYWAGKSAHPERCQSKLMRSAIALIGVGGLGGVIVQHLVGSGVTDYTLIDPDSVALSNLNRQFLFQRKDLGRKKVAVTQEYIESRVNTVAIRTSARSPPAAL